jgi:ribosomal biogenesis protein LAS1
MYSMALVRMTNGICDPSQRGKNAVSVMGIARRHSLPPILVDVRHAATHGELPGLPALQLAASEALNWLHARFRPHRNHLSNAVFMPGRRPAIGSLP